MVSVIRWVAPWLCPCNVLEIIANLQNYSLNLQKFKEHFFSNYYNKLSYGRE